MCYVEDIIARFNEYFDQMNCIRAVFQKVLGTDVLLTYLPAGKLQLRLFSGRSLANVTTVIKFPRN